MLSELLSSVSPPVRDTELCRLSPTRELSAKRVKHVGQEKCLKLFIPALHGRGISYNLWILQRFCCNTRVVNIDEFNCRRNSLFWLRPHLIPPPPPPAPAPTLAIELQWCWVTIAQSFKKKILSVRMYKQCTELSHSFPTLPVQRTHKVVVDVENAFWQTCPSPVKR